MSEELDNLHMRWRRLLGVRDDEDAPEVDLVIRRERELAEAAGRRMSLLHMVSILRGPA